MDDHELGGSGSGSGALVPGNYGRLVLLMPGSRREEFTLSKSRVTVGRSSIADIVVRDPKVSRRHALIECNA